jgi:hypothetical protein
MSSNTTEKVVSKISSLIPSCFHLSEKQYAGRVRIGWDNFYTEYFDTKDEALIELRCLEKRVNYELVKTTEDEGFYPERAIIMEQKYQESGRTNGLYTGLNMKNGQVSVDNPE